jgi:AcrR family transcriptional regulator
MSSMSSTRDRIVETSAELFRAQGYNATGVKQIVTAAQAPFGSLYHFFPGGKEQLGAEAIVVSGALYEQLIPAILDPAADPVTGVRDFFAGAGQHLVDTDYADACPIATVALEVSSVSEPMRQACAQVFESWIEGGARRFRDYGVAPARARELAIAMFAALEGAFVLARATRSIEPMRVAGEAVASEVARALEGRGQGATREPEAASAPAAAVVPDPPRKPRLKARWPTSPA